MHVEIPALVDYSLRKVALNQFNSRSMAVRCWQELRCVKFRPCSSKWRWCMYMYIYYSCLYYRYTVLYYRCRWICSSSRQLDKLTSSSTFSSRRGWSEPHDLGVNFPVIRHFSSSLQNAYSSEEIKRVIVLSKFNFLSASPPDLLTRGSVPGPRWGLCPQSPVIGPTV